MIQTEVLWLCILLGLGTWALRYLPMLWGQALLKQYPWVQRLMAATGPAAIMTLFVASILPEFRGEVPWPMGAGIVVTVGVYIVSHSVVLATLLGAAVYGVIFTLI